MGTGEKGSIKRDGLGTREKGWVLERRVGYKREGLGTREKGWVKDRKVG